MLFRSAFLYRIHRAERKAWWFSSDGSGRFDLTSSKSLGTCYLAEDPLGSFVEVFRDTRLSAEEDVFARRLSALRLRKRMKLADCTSRKTRAWGLTAAIHSGEDYELTQAWARAFHAAGFDGVRYFVSHDPSQRLVGVALFGRAGAPSWSTGRSARIGPALIREAERRFGLRVVPVP